MNRENRFERACTGVNLRNCNRQVTAKVWTTCCARRGAQFARLGLLPRRNADCFAIQPLYRDRYHASNMDSTQRDKHNLNLTHRARSCGDRRWRRLHDPRRPDIPWLAVAVVAGRSRGRADVSGNSSASERAPTAAFNFFCLLLPAYQALDPHGQVADALTGCMKNGVGNCRCGANERKLAKAFGS